MMNVWVSCKTSINPHFLRSYSTFFPRDLFFCVWPKNILISMFTANICSRDITKMEDDDDDDGKQVLK